MFLFPKICCFRASSCIGIGYYSEGLSEYAKKKKKREKNPGVWKKSEVWNCMEITDSPLKCTQMGTLLVLVSPCFRENIKCHMQNCVFLCSLDNFILKNVIVFFFGNQISKWRSFEKKGYFWHTYHICLVTRKTT